MVLKFIVITLLALSLFSSAPLMNSIFLINSPLELAAAQDDGGGDSDSGDGGGDSDSGDGGGDSDSGDGGGDSDSGDGGGDSDSGDGGGDSDSGDGGGDSDSGDGGTTNQFSNSQEIIKDGNSITGTIEDDIIEGDDEAEIIAAL